MTRQELRAGLSLASIFALRMLGLFLILPVFAVAAGRCPAART
jgi:type III secretory pathway component EscT